MAEKASWTMQLRIDGGPAISAASQVTVDAYDKASLDLTKNAATKTVQVQPAPGLARYLVVTASAYSDPKDNTAKVSFKFAKADGTPIGNDIQLVDALVVTGQAALASIAPNWTGLTFTSTFADPITVNVLVCRAAAP